jgi:starch-binding outer membrane protein, SusD/RagB family
MNKKILFLVSTILVLSACEDLLEPAVQNNRGLEAAREEPRFAHGLLINGYARIPTNSWSFSEMATDDAVSNNENHQFSTIATGQWAANNNPLNQWQNSRAAIQYLNLMLQEVDHAGFSENPAVNLMFKDRIKGETYGLRALFMYYLLQAHGGMAGGALLGIPIVLKPEDINADFNQPRSTFEACMQQLYEDAAQAIELLPLDYANIGGTSAIPEKYLVEGADVDDYNRVFGNDARLLLSERIVRAIRAQAALMAASPAFSSGNSTTWQDAANYAAEVIDLNGGAAGLAADGETWFANTAQINAVGGGANPPEILWRTDIGGPSNNLEDQNYPPTLFGDGLVNPTQNLVDAFPMLNGYPIIHPASGYTPANPYANRDPRLRQTVVVNGSTAGPGNSVINTAVDGGTNDGLNRVETSTRTGYYLRKLLRQDVNLNPTSVNSQSHLKPRIRYTEIYLIYAEAANEAWGPVDAGGHAYSAYDVIRVIRQRAGVGVSNNDAYLESIKNDKDAMRVLIRNERRLELSFEGFRFWDLRRWNGNLTETAQGVRIQGGVHEVIPVENRLYNDYMIYGPVPYGETLKFSALQQNNGW